MTTSDHSLPATGVRARRMSDPVVRRRTKRSDAWTTVAGVATAGELEAACSDLGVRFDRARRVYWQRERLFPLAAPAGGTRPSRGHFHRDAAFLAAFVDRCLTRGLPHRPERARSSLVPLRSLVAEWWLESLTADGDAASAEQVFYDRVRAAEGALRLGTVPIDLTRSSPPLVARTSVDAREQEDRLDELDALSLAALIEFAANPRHPAKRGVWRLSPETVRRLVAAWPRILRDGGDGDHERALGRSVARLAAAIASMDGP